ncbi:MAG: TOBE domain-containing protein [Actinomycetota bacterium]
MITEVKRDGLAATVEIRPARVLAFITREAADQLRLEPGMEAIATVKATSVMVNLPPD